MLQAPHAHASHDAGGARRRSRSRWASALPSTALFGRRSSPSSSRARSSPTRSRSAVSRSTSRARSPPRSAGSSSPPRARSRCSSSTRARSRSSASCCTGGDVFSLVRPRRRRAMVRRAGRSGLRYARATSEDLRAPFISRACDHAASAASRISSRSCHRSRGGRSASGRSASVCSSAPRASAPSSPPLRCRSSMGRSRRTRRCRSERSLSVRASRCSPRRRLPPSPRARCCSPASLG